MKKNKGLLSLLTGILFLCSFLVPYLSVQADELSGEFAVEASAAIAIDVETGKVFYDQNSETPLGIASITKLISLYVVEKEIAEGRLAWDDEVSISNYASVLSVHPELSNVPLEQASTYTVKELFDSALIQSANASTVALAEKVAGSEPAFVDLMIEQLNVWGITDLKIVNSSGLNNSFLEDHIYPGSKRDDENELSAKDVAIVARHLIHDYPEILEISSVTTQSFGTHTFSPVEMMTWNWMLAGQAYEKAGVDGLKTGTTNNAGACFVGTMTKDGQRILTVVLNATNHSNDLGARFIETGRLMDYTYDNWRQEIILENGDPVPNLTSVPVDQGKELSVSVETEDSIQMWLHSSTDVSDIEFTTVTDEMVAPLEKGATVGTIGAIYPDTLGYLESTDQTATETRIITKQNVEKANIFVRTWRTVMAWFD